MLDVPSLRRAGGVLIGAALVLSALIPSSSAIAQSSTVHPGGFLEMATSGEIRPRLTAQQIQSLLPQRGEFTFPAPWLTEGVRLTNGSDCGGSDCVNPVGYSYWRNINNHAGGDTMLIFLGLHAGRGGTGPTLFAYDKVGGSVSNLGALFPSGSALRGQSGEGWYFSATAPAMLYFNEGSKLRRIDVLSRQITTVFDAAVPYGSNRYVWQAHSSDDDRVHSATLRSTTTSEMLGCVVYDEPSARFSFFPSQGGFDECHVDKSGRWLLILDNVDGLYGLDNRIVDLQTGAITLLLDQAGALGHADLGFGYMAGEDDWGPLPGTTRVWKFGQPYVPGPTQGLIAYHTTDWSVDAGHLAHGNAKPGIAPEQQVMCSSNALRLDLPRANEIVCYRLDGSREVLVVAPVMTDLNAPGGGDDYSKKPKGNLDVTGSYFIWTANMGGGRLDAFLVKVPSHLLVEPSGDTTPPSVSITSPLGGSTIGGLVTVAALATDDAGVSGVQFSVDGASLGGEVTLPPYAIVWDASLAAPGSHVLTARARDAAGNTRTSQGVTVNVPGDATAPTISAIASSGVTSSGATITWSTNEPADSLVEYGTTASYGSASPLDAVMVTAHSRTLGGISPGTLYHFRVLSRDAAGNLSVSADGTFTTQPVTGGGGGGLKGHWRLDETSGLTASDASGSGMTGTLRNGPRWVTGVVAGSLSFDGVDDHVTIPHGAVQNAFPLSVAFWMRAAGGGIRGLVGKYDPVARNGYQVSIRKGNLCVTFFAGPQGYLGSGSFCASAGGPYNDGRWHHVAFTVDAAGGKLYSDGVLRASRGWTGTPGAPTVAREIWLGRHTGSSNPYLNGGLDDVRLYDRALTAAEVASLHAGSGTGTPVQEPVVWTSVVNCSVSGSTLTKVSGHDGLDDAGAVSQQQIVSGDGFVEFMAPEAGTLRFAGLSNGSSGTGLAEIDFAIRLQWGIADVRENNVWRADTTFVAGDRFRVAVESGSVKYYKNGALLHTSNAAPAYPLLFDTSIVELDGSIADAVISRTP